MTPARPARSLQRRLGNTSSHEFGHALGPDHFATAVNPSGTSVIQNEIMSSPDTGLNREVWTSGRAENRRAQDDHVVISSATDTFRYPGDDYSSSRIYAKSLGSASAGISAAGLISNRTDRDMFSFQVDVNKITTMTVDVNEYTSNLDPTLVLYDSTGRAVSSAGGDSNAYDATLERVLPAGTYYMSVGDGTRPST